MLSQDPLVFGLLDRASFSLTLLDEDSEDSASFTLSSLVDVWSRLPTGLVHAETIELASESPVSSPSVEVGAPRFEPLGPRSIWYARARSLTVVCGASSAAVLLADLARYRHFGRVLSANLGGVPLLADQLLLSPTPPSAVERLAATLDSTVAELSRVLLRYPGLLADIAWLAKRGFDPEVRVQANLRPRVQRARAIEVADRLAARIAADRFSLFVSDDPGPLELISPYASDLVSPLQRWAIENADEISVNGLVEAIHREDEGRRDLAVLVTPDLFRCHPSLLEERRSNEQTQGLFLSDAGGATFGVAEIDRLAAPDPALPSDAGQTLAIVAGGGPVFLATVASRLLETGRVDRTAVVQALDVDSDRVVVPRVVLTPQDGVRLPESEAFAEAASKLGLDVVWVEPLEIVGARAGASPLPLVLGAHRRAWAADQLDPDAPCFVTLYGAPSGDCRIHLERARARLNAGRLALFTVLDPSFGAPTQTGSARRGRLTRTRYRA